MNVCTRQIDFEAIFNFRDLGGYRTRNGNTLAWRRLFRSGDLRNMTEGDLNRIRSEIGLTSVVDLRSSLEIKQQGVGLITSSGIKHHNISLIPDGGDREANERRYEGISNMGEFYLLLVRQKECGQRIIEALEIIAEPGNYPLLFHCAVGKDRTGILAAFLLSVLNIEDEDIINDYALSTSYMEVLLKRMQSEPKMAEGAKGLPSYFWEAGPELMASFLSGLKQEYGSPRGYLEMNGADKSLFVRLEKTLLVNQL